MNNRVSGTSVGLLGKVERRVFRAALILRLLMAGLFPLFCISCAHYATLEDPSLAGNPNTTVLYGSLRYTDNVTTKETTFLRGFRMALQIVNEETHKKVFVKFSKTDPFTCVRVESGRYRITGFIVAEGSDQILRNTQFEPGEGAMVSFEAKPNSAIYVGDYSGSVVYSYYGLLPGGLDGKLKPVIDNYTETTKVFRERYHNFESLPVYSVFDEH
jgi:hypothetical protein